jgi:pimeloyl-ACP methyl ester carboxylesterase
MLHRLRPVARLRDRFEMVCRVRSYRREVLMETISRGFRIHYDTVGAGEPVLLVPGGFQSSANWRDMGYIDALAEGHRVISMDPLGHGESDKPHDAVAYGVANCVDDIRAVLDAQGIGRVHYWGYSLGAHLGYVFALAYPDRLISLTAGGYSTAYPQRWATTLPELAALLTAGQWDRVLDALGASDEATRRILRQNDPDAIAAALDGLASIQRPEIEEMGVRTFVYMGSKEPGLADARRDADVIGATFHVVEGRGHNGTFQSRADLMPHFLAHVRGAVEQVERRKTQMT